MAGPDLADRAVAPRLIPALDAEGEGPHFSALSNCPWLAIEPFVPFRRARWIKISYRLGLYDRPVRPIISFRRGAQEVARRLLPGPALGRGEGLVLAPAGATAAWISPVAQKGPFSFAVESIEAAPLAELLRLGWSGDRGRLFSALATFALGWKPEAELNFCWATQYRPLADWPAYRSRLSVKPEKAGFERPRSDWGAAPKVRLYARLDEDVSPDAVECTIAALQAQIYPHWTLSISGDAAKASVHAAGDPRIRLFDGAWEGDGFDLAGFIGFGDRLARHALACFIEALRGDAAPPAAYCDEDAGTEPLFKPDWSPRLEAARPYVGRLLLARVAHARGRLPACPVEEESFAAAVLRDLTREEVLHIPRPLIAPGPRPPTPLRVEPQAELVSWPHVTVVMPTRDRAALLSRSVGSLLEMTAYPDFDLVIVDNGSTEPAALAALAAVQSYPRVTRVDSPGAFNFSRLCNIGAAGAKGEVLIFLNNDVEITDSSWMREFAVRAIDSRTGAVGCLLVYPDGRIQHAGLVVGMGEAVGHSDAGLAADAPGWLGRNAAAHEVSAVTGACLAVERRKFLAAGGFDEVHLPVEFNDVDLCLRLEEMGFSTLWTPFARLTHFESASRGKATFRRLSAHADERAFFANRWEGRLRDDPFYHPALSRFSLRPALA